MPDRTRKRRPTDTNRRAWEIVQEATGEREGTASTGAVASSGEEEEPEKNPHAVALGRLGGLKGGKARAAKLTAQRRQEIARRAAIARWKQQQKGSEDH
jgi:hypothetical protein